MPRRSCYVHLLLHILHQPLPPRSLLSLKCFLLPVPAISYIYIPFCPFFRSFHISPLSFSPPTFCSRLSAAHYPSLLALRFKIPFMPPHRSQGFVRRPDRNKPSLQPIRNNPVSEGLTAKPIRKFSPHDIGVQR